MTQFYGVWVGRKPGIYTTWPDCQAQTSGYSGAKFMKLNAKTMEEAQAEYDRLAEGHNISKAIKKETSVSKAQDDVLTVDGASNGTHCEYQAVWHPSREQAFASKRFENGTNNIAEFLGLVHAIKYLMEHNKPLKVYTDSVTAMAWIRDKKANTTAHLTGKATNELTQLITEAEQFLQQNAAILNKAEILKWDTKHWGEIPADYGRK